MKIYSKYDSERVVYEDNFVTIRETVMAAIKIEADLYRANLSWADLSKADLSWAKLSGANLYRANLSGADLSGTDLSGADLSWTDLSGANLSGAYLSRSDLSGADLSGSDLSGANLFGADLSGSDLYRANLSWADLSKADLSWAKLSGANLHGVKGLAFHVIQIQGSRDWGTTLPDGRVAIGCEIHDIDEWLKNAEDIGRANNYSEKQIKEYIIYLTAIKEVLHLYKEES